jgi:hypothetical protein
MARVEIKNTGVAVWARVREPATKSQRNHWQRCRTTESSAGRKQAVDSVPRLQRMFRWADGGNNYKAGFKVWKFPITPPSLLVFGFFSYSPCYLLLCFSGQPDKVKSHDECPGKNLASVHCVFRPHSLPATIFKLRLCMGLGHGGAIHGVAHGVRMSQLPPTPPAAKGGRSPAGIPCMSPAHPLSATAKCGQQGHQQEQLVFANRR